MQYDFEEEGIDHKNFSIRNTLNKVSNKIEGWAKKYSFCTNKAVFGRVEKTINKKLSLYIDNYNKKGRLLKKHESAEKIRRRMLGVFSLLDT